MHKRNTHRGERLAEDVREFLSEIIAGMADPRVGVAAVSEVQMSPDTRHARVLVTVIGEEKDQNDTLRALDKARGYLRHELARDLDMRYTPELHFELDRGLEHTSRVEELLRRANKRKPQTDRNPPEKN